MVSLRNFDTSDAKVGSKQNDGNFLNDAKIDPNGVSLKNKKSSTMGMVEPSLPPVGDDSNLINNLKGVNEKEKFLLSDSESTYEVEPIGCKKNS